MKNFSIKIGKKRIPLSGQRLALIAVTLLFVFAVIALIQSRTEIKAKRAELEHIQLQCDTQELENTALSNLLNNSDDEYIERKAREELDFVLPGERVYIVRSGN